MAPKWQRLAAANSNKQDKLCGICKCGTLTRRDCHLSLPLFHCKSLLCWASLSLIALSLLALADLQITDTLNRAPRSPKLIKKQLQSFIVKHHALLQFLRLPSGNFQLASLKFTCFGRLCHRPDCSAWKLLMPFVVTRGGWKLGWPIECEVMSLILTKPR